MCNFYSNSSLQTLRWCDICVQDLLLKTERDMHWSKIDKQTLRLFCLMRTFLDFLYQLPLAIRFHLIVVIMMLDDVGDGDGDVRLIFRYQGKLIIGRLSGMTVILMQVFICSSKTQITLSKSSSFAQ